MTTDRSPSAALRWAGVVLTGAACAAGAALALAPLLAPAGRDLGSALQTQSFAAAAIVVAPLIAAVVGALIAGARQSAPVATVSQPHVTARVGGTPAPPVHRPVDAALQLLALLQQEGRLVDFLEEDLSAYADEQIGAAVRPIHEGCRAVLRDRLVLAPILPSAEGATVTVERGFDPAAVRITGNVRGEPPYRGVLRHPGWRSAGLKLPAPTGGQDPSILAPAEVEVL